MNQLNYKDRISKLAIKFSNHTGRTKGDEYFCKLIDAINKYLDFSCSCLYTIDNDNTSNWTCIANSESTDISRNLKSLIDSEILKQIINTDNPHVIIDLENDFYASEPGTSTNYKYLVSFQLYDSDYNLTGILLLASINILIDHQICIDVIESHIPRLEAELLVLRSNNLLKIYENNYNKFVDSSLDAIWEADISGRITDINSACKAIYGFTDKRMIGKQYTDFMTDTSAFHFVENLGMVAQGKPVYNKPSDHINKDFEHIKVCYNIIPKYDENNNITGIAGTTRDISASVKAQKTIKNTSELFSSILSRLPVIFFRIDDNGYFMDIRGNGLKRMGVEDMDWVGRPVYGLFIGMDEQIDSALSGDTVFFENKGTYKGTPWWFYTSMFFDSWSGYGAVGFSVDITEQKYVEEQLVVLLNNNRKLAQKLVEVQEDERRTLARELHDELGQSITAVKSLATVISTRSGNQYTEIRSLANSIIDLSARLYEVVNKIMQRLRPDIIDGLDFHETIKNCIVRSQLETAGVNCELNIIGNINDLEEVSKLTIYRIVQECLTNISKHAMASNVSIHIQRGEEERARQHPEVYDSLQSDNGNKVSINRDTVTIIISDDGIGMDTDTKMPTSKQVQRHGLQGINERVTAVGGALEISSKPGKGVKIQAVLVLGSSNHDVSHDINKCIADLRKMRVVKSIPKIINTH